MTNKIKNQIKNNDKYNKYIYIICVVCSLLLLIIIYYINKWFYESFSTSSYLDTVDKFIYINLDNREDRKKQILSELDKLNIPENKIQRVSGVYIPKNGHKGCIQGHIIALQLSKMNNWNNVMILEDDAKIVDNMPIDEVKKYINNAINELPQNWNVLMFSTANKNDVELKDKQYINKLNSGTTAAAYLINTNYYDKLLSLFEYCNSMMKPDKWGDDNNYEEYALDQKWLELQKKDNWYCTKINLFNQHSSHSTTNAKGE